MVMVWLEGGQGEVRGASAPPPPPNTPGGALSAVRAQCNYLGL